MQTAHCVVAETLQQMQLLPEKNLNSNQMTPKHFTTVEATLDRLLVGDAKYEREVLVLWPGNSLEKDLQAQKARYKHSLKGGKT